MLTIFQSAAVAVVALPMGAAAQHSTSNTAGQVTGATVKAAMMLGQGNAQFGLAGVPSQLTIAGKGTCDVTAKPKKPLTPKP